MSDLPPRDTDSVDQWLERFSGSWIIWGISTAAVFALMFFSPIHARDVDGKYAGSSLKTWFDHLSSGKGLCCSDADGFAVSDPDWDSKDGHYRVKLNGEWIDVPDDAVITVPNLAGKTMVWPVFIQGATSSSLVITTSLPIDV